MVNIESNKSIIDEDESHTKTQIESASECSEIDSGCNTAITTFDEISLTPSLKLEPGNIECKTNIISVDESKIEKN
jgi:hypothetical protein